MKQFNLFDLTQSKFKHQAVKVSFHSRSVKETETTTEVLVVVDGGDITIAHYVAKELIKLGYYPGIPNDYLISKAESVNDLSVEQYIEALKRTITVHDMLYEKTAPIITDTMYDQLYQELIELESAYPHTKDNHSPTQTIVSTLVESLEKVSHTIPILSLSKANSNKAKEDILKFLKQAPSEAIIVQDKEDGLTVVCRYSKGKLYEAVTRGDGRTGNSIIHSVSQISNIPKNIDFQGYMELRFEVFIPYEEFNRVNVNGEYSNPRNLAAGTVLNLDGSLAKERGLKAYVIEVVEIEGKEFTFDTERIEFVKSLGFEVSNTKEFFSDRNVKFEQETERLLKYLESYHENVRPYLDHMIDGLVIKFNRLALRKQLGETNKHPRWAIAYKFPSEDAITTCTDIVVQVGKTGVLTPVAEFEPVEIAGSVIRRATLHNFNILKSLDIRVGDKILIAKGNDVIPKVVKSYLEHRTGEEFEFELPPVCPECGSALEIKNAQIYCTGDKCPSQMVGKLDHFVSRNAMNIDGLGEKTVSLLYEKGFIRDFADIYQLAQYREQIQSLENFGETIFNNLIQAIEKSKETPLHNVLNALSIRHFGEAASKDIAKIFPSMEAILESAKNPRTLKATLLNVDSIGDKMAESFVNYFTNTENVEVIRRLIESGVKMLSNQTEPNSLLLKGKTFVITGQLSKKREAFKEEIESLGGKVTGSVSKKTDYLLMGKDAEGSSKHRNAVELGVEIITEEDYYNLIRR